MSLEEKVMGGMKDAMKAKDEALLRGLRAIKAEIIKGKTEPGANGQIKITYTNPAQLASPDAWDADNAPFKFSQLVINQGTGNSIALSNWQDIIEVGGAELYDGVNPTPIVGTVNPTNITFPSIPSTSAVDVGFIADANGAASSKTYTLKIWIKNNLNSSLAATVDGLKSFSSILLANSAPSTIAGNTPMINFSQSTKISGRLSFVAHKIQRSFLK